MVKQKNIISLLALVCVGIASSCGGNAPKTIPSERPASKDTSDKRGNEIVAEYKKRDGAPLRKIRVRFTIKSEGEPDKIYELDTWRKQAADGTYTLSKIVKPAEDSDLATLTIEPNGQKATVVTYAKSRDEFRETDTGKMFFGGLTAGELLGEWDKYDYKFLGEKEIDGEKMLEVEGKLKSDADAAASRETGLFRADNYMLTELHMFDNNDREIRAYKVTDIKGDADHPYAARTEVDNPVYKAKIIIEILSREFPDKLDDSLFTRETLKQYANK